MPEDPHIGRQLANYRVERVLGRGGMAVVYYATDVRLRRPAAVKVIDARFRGDQAYAERFIQEARSAATLHHENILQVYYAGDEEGLFYFAMEYIDGQNLGDILAELVEKATYLPYEDVLRYGRAIASALDYAHSRGVIHRDVKPNNVMVARDGRVALNDFGLAMDVRQGSFGEVSGTAIYTAPEQARRSNAAVPQSDLYSLGIVLYEMLTNTVPFDDPSPTSIAIQHLTQPVPSPRQRRPELSEAVEAVLMKALAKNPAERYPTGQALMLNLEDALIRMVPSLPTVRSQSHTPEPDSTIQVVPRKDPLPTQPFALAPQGIESPVQAESQADSAAQANLRKGEGLLVSLTARHRWIGALGLAGVVLVALVIGGILLLRKTAPSKSTYLPVVAGGSSAAAAPATLPPMEATQAAPQPTAPDPAAVPAVTQPAAAEPSATASVAAAQSAVPTLTWTPKYASGRRMILYWNASSFYALQVTGYGEVIGSLVFERLDTQGLGTNRFSSKLWAEYSPNSLRDWCYRLKIGGPDSPPGGVPYLEPPQCKNQYLATRFPPANDPTIFWTAQEGSREFRVLWGREEIQRCEISLGTCEVYIP